MLNESRYYCPECDEGFELRPIKSRRDFLRGLGGVAAAAALGSAIPSVLRAADSEPKPAEGLICELYATLSAEQKSQLVRPYDDGGKDNLTRKKTFNAPPLGSDKRISNSYTKPQQELIRRIVRSIMSGDDAVERLSRHGHWDSSGSLEGCGAAIFGTPDGQSPFAWVFSGHHLTLRCDGNSEPNSAWGGPIYYGHSEPGYSSKNVYYYQTQQVQAVFDALDEKQRTQAMAKNNPGEGGKGLRATNPRHGVAYRDLSADQRALVERVMKTLLAPFRSEDVDEVMQIVKSNGGMELINLAFYKDEESTDKEPWHFWRLEGPGFVWNYRPLPHVHCFVNVLQA
jgi:hypothetical protein